MAAGADSSQLRKFAADLRTESGRVTGRGATVMRKTTQGIIRDAKAIRSQGNNPTGNLLNSITAEYKGDGRSNRMSAEIGPTADYGIFVELGTQPRDGHPGSRPQPYLFPAADRWEPAFVQAMAQVVLPNN